MIPHVNDNNNQFEEVDVQYTKEHTKNIKWHRQLMLNKPLKVSIALVLFAVLTPVLLYHFIYYAAIDLATSDGFSLGSCLVPRTSRLLCGLGNVSADDCHPQCCYDFSNNMCFHRYPSRFSYVMDRKWTEELVLKPRVATVPFRNQNSFKSLRLSIDEVSETHLTITYYNARNKSLSGRRIKNKQYLYDINAPELNIVVSSANGIIFDTLRGPLIASENIWEIAFKLTEETIYGFGEIPIKEGTAKMIYNHKGGLNSIPLIFAKSNETYHGLLLDIPEPTEVSFGTDQRIVVRSITNFGLKFHIFVGPKPVDIMKDVIKYMKFKNELEYWMLGPHFCSKITDTPININTFIQQARTHNMPFESHCVTPIVFENACGKDHTKDVKEGTRLLRNAGKRFVTHVSPYIIYREPIVYETSTIDSDYNKTNTRKQDNTCYYDFEEFTEFMLLESENVIYKGLVENKDVIYPNYNNISAEILQHLWDNTTDFDAFILENTWPLDESDKNVNETYLHLPYFSEHFENAFLYTPKWNTMINNGEENYLYTHNKYGDHFANSIENMKAAPIWSSSTWLNPNVHVNRQSIDTSWTNLRRELIEAALGGISGQWLWLSPVCGDTENFNSETHSSLCLKWYMAATYFPMIKIHSKETLREPDSFSATHRTLMINALRTRLTLAPYFYTVLQEGPLLRPMFYQFPEVDAFKNMITQFSVGEALLIVPNLEPEQSLVHFWMPPGIWYELWSGLRPEGEELEAVTMATTEFDFLVMIQGGNIVPMQKDVKLTAESTRSESNLSLTIALSCNIVNNTNGTEQRNITDCVAIGDLYMGKNKTVHFAANGEVLKITTDNPKSFCNETEGIRAQKIDEINIYGLDQTLNNFDHYRQVKTTIDLCQFEENDEIEFDFGENDSND